MRAVRFARTAAISRGGCRRIAKAVALMLLFPVCGVPRGAWAQSPEFAPPPLASPPAQMSPPLPAPEPITLPESTPLLPDSPLPPAERPASSDFLTPPPIPSTTSVEPGGPGQPGEPLAPPPQPDDSKWHVHVRLASTLTYDDNIFIQPSQKQADYYFGVTPLIAAGWGTFQADPTNVTGVGSRFPEITARDYLGNAILFRYAPTFLLFVHHRDQDAVNQDAMVGGRWVSDKLTLDGAARFQTLSAPDIDVGNRINSEVTSALLNAHYQMTQRTSLDSRFALQHDSYQGGLDSTDLEITSLLNYQIRPKTMIGIGAGLGYTTVEGGQDQYYEQGLFHARWEPTAKLSFQGTVGVEVRQITNGATRVTPVFEAGINYAALDSTVFRLSASRHTETSALYFEQDIQRTTIEASIRQRLLQKIYLTVSGGFQHIDYVNAGASANRTDNFTYFGIQSAWEVTKWLSMRASYRHQDDDSSNGDFSFRRNLTDFQVNIQF